jgi:hypothetical protein
MEVKLGGYILKGLADSFQHGFVVIYSEEDDVRDWKFRRFGKLLKDLTDDQILTLRRSLPRGPLMFKAKKILEEFLVERRRIESGDRRDLGSRGMVEDLG